MDFTSPKEPEPDPRTKPEKTDPEASIAKGEPPPVSKKGGWVGIKNLSPRSVRSEDNEN
jgi:hypothetical protein